MTYIEKPANKIFVVGVELGEPAQGTAISFMQVVYSSGQTHLQLRQLKRFPPGTSYVKIGHVLKDILDSVELRESQVKTAFGIRNVEVTFLLAIDQTAVGSSVVNTITNIVNRPHVWRVFISGSHSQGYSDSLYLVPKPEFISLVRARMEEELLKFAKDLVELDDLIEAFIHYQDRKANPTLQEESLRTHRSEDLVLAVALACWVPQQDTRFSADWMR